jgi:hypothetical protein
MFEHILLHAQNSLEIGISRGCRRLDIELDPSSTDVDRHCHVRDQGESGHERGKTCFFGHEKLLECLAIIGQCIPKANRGTRKLRCFIDQQHAGIVSWAWEAVVHLLTLLGLGFSGFSIWGPNFEIPNSMHQLAHLSVSNKFSRSTSLQVYSGPIIFIPIHRPAHFQFVIIVKDDGKDSSGGWQEAKANLPFAQTLFPVGLRTWQCPITIGMPIRHRTRGYITFDTAAVMSAAVTNSAASNTDFNLPEGIFCDKFRDNVKAAFPTIYPKLGQSVGR